MRAERAYLPLRIGEKLRPRDQLEEILASEEDHIGRLQRAGTAGSFTAHRLRAFGAKHPLASGNFAAIMSTKLHPRI